MNNIIMLMFNEQILKNVVNKKELKWINEKKNLNNLLFVVLLN